MHKTVRNFILLFLIISLVFGLNFCTQFSGDKVTTRIFNSNYSNEYLNKVAFPIGGIGAGMICLEGTGAISHVSVRNKME